MPSTTPYKRGDIVLVKIPSSDSEEEKKRPALIVSAKQVTRYPEEYILAGITSSIHTHLFDDEILLSGLVAQEAGLIKESVLRTRTLFAINQNRIDKKLGHLPPKIVQQALEILRSTFT